MCQILWDLFWKIIDEMFPQIREVYNYVPVFLFWKFSQKCIWIFLRKIERKLFWNFPRGSFRNFVQEFIRKYFWEIFRYFSWRFKDEFPSIVFFFISPGILWTVSECLSKVTVKFCSYNWQREFFGSTWKTVSEYLPNFFLELPRWLFLKFLREFS